MRWFKLRSPSRSDSCGCWSTPYFLLGHKFSGIVFNLLLFAVPTSLARLGRTSRAVSRNPRRVALVAALVGIFALTMVRYVTANFDHAGDILTYVHQRILVQQGELWWSTHQRVVELGKWDPSPAFAAVFGDELGSRASFSANEALMYLMSLELGAPVKQLFESGYLYTGASPTILLELFGLRGGYLVWFVGSIVYAWLLYLLWRSVARRALFRAVLITLVFGLLHNVMVAGDVAELASWTFGVKVVVLVAALVAASRQLEEPSR